MLNHPLLIILKLCDEKQILKVLKRFSVNEQKQNCFAYITEIILCMKWDVAVLKYSGFGNFFIKFGNSILKKKGVGRSLKMLYMRHCCVLV